MVSGVGENGGGRGASKWLFGFPLTVKTDQLKDSRGEIRILGICVEPCEYCGYQAIKCASRSVFSKETWKTHRKAAGNGNPGFGQGGAGQKGAQDQKKFRGDYIRSDFSQFEPVINVYSHSW
jgi:hypothetical protein